jgi:hypothetical protein
VTKTLAPLTPSRQAALSSQTGKGWNDHRTARNSDTGIGAESGATVTAFNNTIDGNFRGVLVNGATANLFG